MEQKQTFKQYLVNEAKGSPTFREVVDAAFGDDSILFKDIDQGISRSHAIKRLKKIGLSSEQIEHVLNVLKYATGQAIDEFDLNPEIYRKSTDNAVGYSFSVDAMDQSQEKAFYKKVKEIAKNNLSYDIIKQ